MGHLKCQVAVISSYQQHPAAKSRKKAAQESHAGIYYLKRNEQGLFLLKRPATQILPFVDYMAE